MNNITNITSKYDSAYLKEATQNKRSEMPTQAATGGSKTDAATGDKVSLSEASRDFALAQQAVAAAPDARAEKVAQVKQAIEAGDYRVNPQKVAEKMIGEIVSEVV
jgi:negative regulator of flagellin synthesis FlgM